MPYLDLSKKLANRPKNSVFKGAPMFDSLPNCDLTAPTTSKSKHPGDFLDKGGGHLTLQKLDDAVKSVDHLRKNRKNRRKRDRDPTIRKLRVQFGKMAKFHSQFVEEELPCIYPVLGPAAGSDDDESQSSDSGGSDA
jgi:hypothetical protein